MTATIVPGTGSGMLNEYAREVRAIAEAGAFGDVVKLGVAFPKQAPRHLRLHSPQIILDAYPQLMLAASQQMV